MRALRLLPILMVSALKFAAMAEAAAAVRLLLSTITISSLSRSASSMSVLFIMGHFIAKDDDAQLFAGDDNDFMLMRANTPAIALMPFISKAHSARGRVVHLPNIDAYLLRWKNEGPILLLRGEGDVDLPCYARIARW